MNNTRHFKEVKNREADLPLFENVFDLLLTRNIEWLFTCI